MTRLAKIVRTFAIAAGLAAAGMATSAQAQNSPCGVTGSASAAPVVYDPFNPSGLASTTITVNLTRVNTSGGGDTRIVNFYLRANATTGTAADGSSIVASSVAGQAAIEGIGLNIFHNYNGPFPTLPLNPINSTPTGGNRYLEINFTGNNAASNTAQVNFTVSLPANLNLNAVQNLAFDAYFTCNIQGGQSNGATNTGTFANAVVFPVTVLSALRTYYAGTDLAFGEIGNIPPVPLAPVRTNPANYVFVQSSGAYSVQLSSQNAFKMKKPGAVAVGDEVRYSLKFLGDTRSTATTPTPGAPAISHTCMRAGLATAGQTLPIQATLIDGGQGKNPSPTYTDILTVTIAPLAYSTVSADNCGSYSVP
jgi:hypothetical protein